MELDEFYGGIEDRLGGALEIEPDEAAHAVLVAMAGRLTAEEAAELGAELPDALGDLLGAATGERPFDRDEFIEDVAARLDLDDVDAERVALAVLATLRSALEPALPVEQVIEGLPSDLAQLMRGVE
jgi:uncharacterized protein (DUF2267 family)